MTELQSSAGPQKMTTNALIRLTRSIIPPLSPSLRKGDLGCVAVIGGCFEYTGAPFYAAISALKTGADLAHVFCTPGASVPIKSYSPELIVHPVLACSNESGSRSPIDSIEEIGRWLKKMTAVVVGPGLGRDDATLQVASAIMQKAREMDLPLVIDADGLHVVRLDPQLVKGYRRCILTPNANEFQRLRDALPADKTDPAAAGQPLSVVKENPQHPLPKITEEALSLTSALCRALDGVTIVRKGPSDCISDGRVGMVCAVTGASKRAGGQGDVLSGSAATFVSWAMRGTDEAEGPPRHLLACYGACALTRASAAAAFAKKRRSMTAPDVISELGEVFESLCG
ncbi:unnamed protein product [Vitrella brassicaformis CCMP3155]|uniref:ATP-dependent (S)-NAD(P)H-hydrate dehydratase n=3 Tax=Vitrella brassicaformis TaxID=1169539 RepID=A0A0G4EGS2_VITBC|nr:unnamed protein product [Vitrella brassicaformis CCMP3155]|eukprot:CEL95447.1 unnamed protein product [Vitrella brassicaformis CCMP3155]